MKILYYSSHPIINQTVSSGPGTHIREMIGAMRELGHEVVPVIMGDENSNSEQLPAASNRTKIFSIIHLCFFKVFMLLRGLKTFVPAALWRTLKEIKLMRFDKYAERIIEKKIKKFKPD